MSETPPCDSRDTLSSFKKHLESLKETTDKHIQIHDFKDIKENAFDQSTGARDCTATVITSSGDHQISYQVNASHDQTAGDSSQAWVYLGMALAFYAGWVWVVRRAGQSKIVQWGGGFLATIMLAIGIPTYIDHQEQLQPPTSIESARSKMIGTWTFTEALDFSSGKPFPFEWVKWDIREDGTMTAWHASPADNDWGKGETKHYEIITDKYASNGERWYGIEDTNGYITGVYERGNIVLHMRPAISQSTGVMKRGDRHPFSQ